MIFTCKHFDRAVNGHNQGCGSCWSSKPFKHEFIQNCKASMNSWCKEVSSCCPCHHHPSPPSIWDLAVSDGGHTCRPLHCSHFLLPKDHSIFIACPSTSHKLIQACPRYMYMSCWYRHFENHFLIYRSVNAQFWSLSWFFLNVTKDFCISSSGNKYRKLVTQFLPIYVTGIWSYL